MKINILAFGIAKDIIEGQKVELSMEAQASVGELKTLLCEKYPAFEKLRSFSIAVNEEYRLDDFQLTESDEVVIIPPVSGG